jgi:tetratricopeptide (TPR) repeat protein
MFHREIADAERMEQVILLAVREILRHETLQPYLAWARHTIPGLLDLSDADLSPEEETSLSVLLAQAIWNATPLPSHGFRPQPIPLRAPDEPCPCGSGVPFGACCGALAEVPEMPEELVWEILLDELPERGLQEALSSGAIPDFLLAKVGDRWLEQDHPGRAVALLEPLFAEPESLDGRFDAALDVLSDAYEQLDHWRKGRAFLERIAQDAPRDLKAAAWQRLCTQHLDSGDFASAQDAYAQAQRNAPDSARTAVLEITLLAAQHKDAIAALRAHFWRRKLERAGFREEPFMDFLGQAALDPQAALVASHAESLDPPLLQLRDWIESIATRPLPDYTLEPLGRPVGDVPPEQLPLFAEADLGGARLPSPWTGDAVRLRPPRQVRDTEAAWHQVYPAVKPYSTQLALMEDGDPWAGEGWLRFLTRHPRAADSLDILDDLATALYEHPESSLPWIAQLLLVPLLTRATAILDRCLPREIGRQIPWSEERNRPALRLLFRLYLWHTETDREGAAAAVLERLLALNPQDNHGVRAELMNHLLRRGEDARALELARSFPGDILADLAYGEVLALYRLGDQAQARRVLHTAVVRLPRIPHYLTRKRIKQPAPGPFGRTGLGSALGLAPGGEDQAWLYREAMRDVWEAEPGILAWLKKYGARGKA